MNEYNPLIPLTEIFKQDQVLVNFLLTLLCSIRPIHCRITKPVSDFALVSPERCGLHNLISAHIHTTIVRPSCELCDGCYLVEL